MTDTPKTPSTSTPPSTSKTPNVDASDPITLEPLDTPNPPSNTSTSTPDRQYVAKAVDDNRLEPDAMRGSEQYLNKVENLDNQDADRTKKLQEQSKRPE